MGKKIDPAQSRLEAANFLSLALALLDQANASVAAIYVSTAIDILTADHDASSQLSDANAGTRWLDDAAEFSVSWGTLLNHGKPKTGEPQIAKLSDAR